MFVLNLDFQHSAIVNVAL